MTIEPTFEKFYKSGAFTCARSHAPPPCHTYSKHQLSLHAHLSKNDPSDFPEILPVHHRHLYDPRPGDKGFLNKKMTR